MSHRLISRNPDLRQLRDDGYDVEIRGGHLLLKGVPYVNSAREIKHGTLVSILTLAGNVTVAPSTHVAFFVGEHPCHATGLPIEQIRHSSGSQALEDGLTVDHSFSNRPKDGYTDHYHKMSTYASILSGPARAIDPTVTAQAFRPIPATEDDSVFEYVDTASSRAGIAALNSKFEHERVGIVGLGGTGSYVLDLVAKTPVSQIHLFDGDVFSQHNAFRSPGAATLDDLRTRPRKVDYFKGLYSRMHRRITAHGDFLDAANVDVLTTLTTVFVCLDNGPTKKIVVDRLDATSIPFIDVGMGLVQGEDCLTGILRVTTSTPAMRGHVHQRISFTATATGDYGSNIQVADLNALNATLAVIKWKKLLGFYADFQREHHSTYTVDGNSLTCEDVPCPPT